MPRKPSVHRKDSNHDDIAAVFERRGCKVYSATSLGDGFPDMVVQDWKDRVFLVEAKLPNGDLTEKQKAFLAKGWKVFIVRSPFEAEGLVNAWSNN